MKENVTIVPSDCTVIVNGEYLNIDAISTVAVTEDVNASSIHAIQWHSDTGHVEFVDNIVPNQTLSGAEDYAMWVAPLVALWETEKARLEEIANTPPTPPTLEEAQQAQLNAINAQYDAIVAMAKVNTPDGEVLTWDIQKTEAEGWAADNSAATPFIDGIAQGRGMDRVVLIEKVLVKTAAYRDFVAIKTGIRQGLEDAIFAAETVEAVSAIVWPVDDNEGTNNASAG